MMRTLAQTGNGWMTFKDKSNRAATRPRSRAARCTCRTCAPRSSRSPPRTRWRCATSARSTSPHVVVQDDGRASFDFDKLDAHGAHRGAPARSRDRPELLPHRLGARLQLRWRPVGLGVMGLQDVFFQLRLAFDAPEARALSQRSPRRSTSTRCRPPASWPPRRPLTPAFGETRAARGELQFDAWGVTPSRPVRWDALRARIRATACATRCWWPSRPPRRSRRSPAATSASSRRCRTCSSARRCRATSSRSTATW
jgi:ribonucleoside-diphosphate reductase alpha chain